MIFEHIPAARFIAETRALIAPPYKPKFRSIAYSEIGNTGIPHSYLVKNLLVDREKSVLGGESQAGKSFLATDLGFAVCRGVDFQGFKVRNPKGVVYIASESAGGVVNMRVPAYKKHFGLSNDELPIRFVVQSPDLFNGVDQTKALIQDIQHYASTFPVPLGLIIIDTFSASTPGADENKGADVSRILGHLDMIREQCEAHVMIVHHMNAGGEKLRGHTSIFANFDTVLTVQQTEEHDRPEQGNARKIRTMTTAKQKDGVQGSLRKFILRVIDLGQDEDGDPITSCVCDAPENMTGPDLTTKWAEPGMYRLPKVKGIEVGTRALINALKRHGRTPPKEIAERARGAECITLTDWMNEWRLIADDKDVGADTLTNRLKKQRESIVNKFMHDNILEKHGEWVWRTKRRINGYDIPWSKTRHDAGTSSVQKESAPPDLGDAPDPRDPFAGLPFD
jgi:hypothetical protein